ncbi:DUF4817 domain-containing protein [Trichonephila clavipes]|nr:DUF4817 domain-containing protein [Trichonephila clavipes]
MHWITEKRKKVPGPQQIPFSGHIDGRMRMFRFPTDTLGSSNYASGNDSPCHKGLIFKEWLEEHSGELEVIFWPPNSPDLNPISNFWFLGNFMMYLRMPGTRYLKRLVESTTSWVLPILKELWFQQDGATCHTARATIDLLKDTFGDRLISRFGPANWPPRSCDFTPLDYFLWGYVKSLVYADNPQTLDHLEDNIRRVTATNVGKSHRKLNVQIGLHSSQPWQSYARNHI